jgi:hypothetical protein
MAGTGRLETASKAGTGRLETASMAGPRADGRATVSVTLDTGRGCLSGTGGGGSWAAAGTRGGARPGTIRVDPSLALRLLGIRGFRVAIGWSVGDTVTAAARPGQGGPSPVSGPDSDWPGRASDPAGRCQCPVPGRARRGGGGVTRPPGRPRPGLRSTNLNYQIMTRNLLIIQVPGPAAVLGLGPRGRAEESIIGSDVGHR